MPLPAFARGIALLVACLAYTGPLRAQPHIAPTEALSPAAEQKALIVPPGFEVQLVAAEPQIQKPIQMAFDAKGRLWVTTSHHYPFAGPAGKSHDKLFILSDFGPDGRAAQVTVFSDTLNIPIGILPLPDCRSCIVSSVGEILKLTDTNDDGRADKTEVLFTGFGTRDMHGMYNSFTLLPDGWVYACHGFSNESTVKGKDGHEVHMQSGHVFRFRPDGSRIEIVSRGQVNPFGMTVDPWFNLYTADCHSKPITQIISGAFYQSFGKQHDGLGFAPHVTHHDHGSTALCGLTWYDANHFPKQYKGTIFLGNVVTNRVNFDRIEWKGSTPVAIEQPDFLVSKDPWFRPADIKLGPDGALYITDFYNRIIGHYEVDLRHPLRDKDRGRVWRVVWKGTRDPKTSATNLPKMPGDLTKMSTDALIAKCDGAGTALRILVLNQLIHRLSNEPGVLATARKQSAHRDIVLWLAAADLQRKVPQNPEAVPTLLRLFSAKDSASPEFDTVQFIRVIASLKSGSENDAIAQQITKWMESPDRHIRRATIDAIIAHPAARFIPALVKFLISIPPDDTHLRYAARVALRYCVASKDGWKTAPDSPLVADVAIAIPTTESAAYLAKVLTSTGLPKQAEAVTHIARYGDQDARERVVLWSRAKNDWHHQHTVATAFRKGVAARGQSLRPSEASFCKLVAIDGLANKESAVVQQSCELAGALKLKEAAPPLLSIAADAGRDEAERASAFTALTAIDPKAAVPLLASSVMNPATPIGLRVITGNLLGGIRTPQGHAAARIALKATPYRVTVGIAGGLAGSKSGAEALLEAVKAGEASPRLLQEKAIAAKLKASGIGQNRIVALTKGLPPVSVKIAELIKVRATQFASARPDPALGAKLFTKHCGACHQIGGVGGKVGPNLDSIGVRGLERLLEDTLDPNRNVDAAFRARVLNLTDGTSKTGLRLRVEGEVVVLADEQGKEFRVPIKEIEKERETMLSPMPANFGEIIPAAEFFHILAFLLDQKAKVPPKK